MNRLRYTVVLVSMTIAGMGVARGTPLLTYPDVTSWLGAVTVLGDATFETGNTSPGTIKNYNTGPYSEADAAGVSFTGSNWLFVVNPSASQTWYHFGSGNSLSANGSDGLVPVSITATLPANVTAVALNMMVTGNAGLPVVLTFSDGTQVTVPTSSGQASFYGATFASPITWVAEASSGTPPVGTYVMMDNFSYGTANQTQQDPPPDDTPELATLLLIGTGLVAMASFRKRMI